MTSAYLLSTLSRSSSMGGLVMPSGLAAVPATPYLTSLLRRDCPTRLAAAHHLGARAHEGDERLRRLLDRRVDENVVELVLGGQLDPGGVEPALDDIGVLGAAAAQPAFELVPRRRLEEHQPGVGHQSPHLPGTLHLDLEQYELTAGQPLL